MANLSFCFYAQIYKYIESIPFPTLTSLIRSGCHLPTPLDLYCVEHGQHKHRATNKRINHIHTERAKKEKVDLLFLLLNLDSMLPSSSSSSFAFPALKIAGKNADGRSGIEGSNRTTIGHQRHSAPVKRDKNAQRQISVIQPLSLVVRSLPPWSRSSKEFLLTAVSLFTRAVV